MKTGLIVEIYRSEYDCPINVFYQKKSALLIGVDCPFTANDDRPEVKLVRRNIFGKDYIHAEPVEPGFYAFGGSFIYTSDSRFGEASPSPIPLHDRQMNLE